MVDHPGDITVIPVDSSGDVITVRQFRYPLCRKRWRYRQASSNTGGPIRVRNRELSEETGVRRAPYKSRLHLYLSGFQPRNTSYFLALDLTYGCAHDETSC